MHFMTCNSCQRVVQINNTGICLGCQRGFTGVDAEDVYKQPILNEVCTQDISEINENNTEIKRLQDRQKEIEDALEKVGEQKGSITEYKDGNGCRKASKASGGNRSKRRKKI